MRTLVVLLAVAYLIFLAVIAPTPQLGEDDSPPPFTPPQGCCLPLRL